VRERERERERKGPSGPPSPACPACAGGASVHEQTCALTKMRIYKHVPVSLNVCGSVRLCAALGETTHKYVKGFYPGM
jgi:hypothetical protein